MKYIQQYIFLFFLFFGFSSQSFGQTLLCNSCEMCYGDCEIYLSPPFFDMQQYTNCVQNKNKCMECTLNPRAYRDCNLYTPPPPPPPPAPPKECFEVENPTTSPNDFNWSAREWKVWVKTKNGVRENYYSPFYDDESDNINSDLEFLNINIPIKPTNLDGQPRDGWVLLYHKIGKSATDPMTYPMFVFYNKYRATIRVFWLLGSTTEQDYTKGTIEMSYGNADYRSNVFSTHKTPMVALEKGMPGDATLDVVSQFSNDPFEPFWIFGEFPVVYDPCACEYEKGNIGFRLVGVEKYDINLTLRAQDFNQGIPTTEPSSKRGFMDFFKDQKDNVYKLTEGMGSYFSSLKEATQKTYRIGQGILPSQMTLQEMPSQQSNSNLNIGNFFSFIPYAGAALSIIDYFTGGGDETKQAKSPSQVVLMNDLVGTGTMEKSNDISYQNMAIPGAAHKNESNQSKIPYYDNPLGVMNLVYTPKMEINANASSCDNELRFRLSSIPEFTVNPFLGIDLASSEIDIALEVDIKNNGFVYENGFVTLPRPPIFMCFNRRVGTNLELVGTTLDNRILLRSPYTPINCDVTDRHWWIGLNYTNIDWANLDAKFSLKVVARLKRRDPRTGIVYEDPAKHITYIAKYAVDITLLEGLQLTTYAASTSLNVPDYRVEFGDNPGDVGQIINSSYPASYGPITETMRVAGKIYGTRNFISGKSIDFLPGTLIAPQNLTWRHCYTNWFTYKCDNHNSYQSIDAVFSINEALQGRCFPRTPPVAITKENLKEFCKNQSGGVYHATHYNKPLPEEESAAEGGKINENILTLYPNPASQFVTFAFEIEDATQSKIYVTDIMGNKITDYTQFTAKEKGKYEVVADVSMWANGIYLVILETKNEKVVKKLVVTK